MKEIFIVMMMCGSQDYPITALPTKETAKKVIKYYEQIDLEAGLKPHRSSHYYIEKVHLFEKW